MHPISILSQVETSKLKLKNNEMKPTAKLIFFKTWKEIEENLYSVGLITWHKEGKSNSEGIFLFWKFVVSVHWIGLGVFG